MARNKFFFRDPDKPREMSLFDVNDGPVIPKRMIF